MARIGEYTQQVFLDRSQPSNIEAAGGILMNKVRDAQLQSQMYQERGAAAAKWGHEVQAQRDIQGELRAREQFNQFQRSKIDYQNKSKQERMTSPDGFAQEFDDWHRSNAGEIEDGIMSAGDNQPFNSRLFRQLMDNDRTSSYEENTNWENGMRVKNITSGIEQNVDAMNVNFALTNPGLKDLKKQIEAGRQYVSTTGAKTLSPEEQVRLMGYSTDKSAKAVLDNLKESDPKKLRNVLLYGGGSKDQLIDFVFDIEGRDQIAQEPDGAIAKFGINSKYNNMTHDQVKNLTADDARAILSKKYWDPRLDKMDPAFRAVAFDTLVQHGNDKNSWAMIQAAKGDPNALLYQRQQKYAALAQKPGNEIYKAGWDKRVKELSGYVNAQEDGGKDFLQYASLISPEIITTTQAEIPAAIAAQDRRDALALKARVAEFDASYKTGMDDLTSDVEPLSPERLDQIEQIAVNSGDQGSVEKAKALRFVNSNVQNYRSMNEMQMEGEITALSKVVKTNDTPYNRSMLEIAQKVKKSMVDGIKNEGIGYYSRLGNITPIGPLNFQDPSSLSAELAQREKSAVAVQGMNGKPISIITPTELQGLSEVLKTGNPMMVAAILEPFSKLGDDTQAYIGEAAKDDPILGAVLGQDDETVSAQIIRGSRIEPFYTPAKMKSQIYQSLATMNLDPNAIEQLIPAIEAYYKADAYDAKEVQTDKDIDTDRVQKSIDNVLGPSVDLGRGWFDGAESKVFSMRDPDTGEFVSENDMYDMFNSIGDREIKKLFPRGLEDADGKEITAGNLDDFNFVSAGSGSYYIIRKDKKQYVPVNVDEPYRPIVLDGKALLSIYKSTHKLTKQMPKREPRGGGFLPMG